ncbi:putative transmembrane sensor domain protein [Cylindrospermum stagnale PCC 7417]|uniref:Putative transmembrane sensor domain protein n=1 Tax=Cylindrospermum stagnale PCC 7417 TaxID=56107 RepID=K9WXD0_9NOST|nr:CHASE2 domain-containing protein [Cylindrospermum stagnale]AFZ24152.1 putative transmembrane sensor domain protein [Cylindrospermum stagnale PCC 7417]
MQESSSRFRNLPQAVLTFGGTVVLTSLVVTGLIVGLRELGKLEGLELGAFDGLMRSLPDKGPDNRFLVVGIDDVDIQTRKEYPIEDGTLAKALTKLEDQGAEVIGIDILRDVKQGAAAGRQELVDLLTQSERIVAVCELSRADAPGTPAAPGIPEDRVGVADLPVDAGGTIRQGMILAIPQKSNIPLPVEHICNNADPENQLPSLSFQMVVRYLQAKDIEPEQIKSGEIKFKSTILHRLQTKAGAYRQLNPGAYQILLNYRSPKNAVKQVSLRDLLADKVPATAIKDKIVLVGYTADIVKDTFYTPYSAGSADNQKMPGVVVHAQNASQILSAVLDQKPLLWYWNDWQESLWIFGWTVLGAILAWRIRTPWLLVLGGGVAIAILVGTSYLIFIQAGWIPLVPPLIGLLASVTSVVLIDRYAATIVKTVKGFLKINVEIDEKKKNEEVAAIVESDYFLDLQQKAKGLKSRDKNEVSATVEPPLAGKFKEKVIDTTPTTQPIQSRRSTEIINTIPTVQPTQPIEFVDYLQQVRDKRNKLKASAQVSDASIPETIPAEIVDGKQEPSQTENQEEMAYLEQLQRRGKKMREGKK